MHERAYALLVFSILILGCAVLLYSVLFFDVPIPTWLRNSLGGLRILFLCILLYLIISPYKDETISTRITPTIYIALDDTQSMSYPINPILKDEGDQSRWDTMQNIIQQNGIFSSLEDRGFKLKYSRFSDVNAAIGEGIWSPVLPDSSQVNYSSTNMSNVIQSFGQQAKYDESAYLLLFTDGQWTQGGSPSLAAASLMQQYQEAGTVLDYRIYSYGIGTADDINDVMIESFNLPSDIRSGDAVSAKIQIGYRGVEPNDAISVRLWGLSNDQTVIMDETIDVTFDGKAIKTLDIPLPDLQKGEYQFTSEILNLSDDIFTENNVSARGVRVRESKDRVLILTSSPTWEMKFMKRALEDHPSIDTHAYFIHDDGITFLGDPTQTTEEMPVYENINALQDSFSRWSVIVLSNFYFRSDFQSMAESVSSYVENGGGLVVLPGMNNSAPTSVNVEPVLPPVLNRVYAAVEQRFVVPAERAVTSPLLSQVDENAKQNLIPLTTWYRNVKPEQNAVPGIPLLQGIAAVQQSIPLVELYRVGLGRIIVAYTDSFWRWDMMTNDSVLPVFWVSTVYQAQPQLLTTAGEIYTDQFTYGTFEPVEIEYTIRESVADTTADTLSLTITHQEQEERIWLESVPNQPNSFRGRYTPTQAGEYSISTIGDEAKTSFNVEESIEEMNDLRQNITSLQEIASIGGGEYANLPAWKTQTENIPLSTKLKEDTQRRFTGEKWWIVSILIVLLGLEWFTRWRRGLP